MKEHTTEKREFVVGESNIDAWNDALRAAVFPEKYFNPLFICGQSAVGKTLLLSIIGDVVRNRYPLLHVEQTGTIELCDEIVEAICKDSIHEFREKFSSIDVLLVDDIQFVAEKIATQEELFDIFNRVCDKGLLVITSDRPFEGQPLFLRMKERYKNLHVSYIHPADRKLRIAMIHGRASETGLRLDDDFIQFIADNTSNSRQIDGLLNQLRAGKSKDHLIQEIGK